ncbi:MAG: NTP transferase domain-containing protein [Bacteroidetes bacterium]|nr:NTP transferase domain-containing protein [Bacteroidota bacterium]
MNSGKLNGLLISAGLSGRMGEFKPLMQFNHEPFVTGIVRKLLEVCDRVVVVTGYESEKVESVCRANFAERITFVYNPYYEKEMFTSLKAGIEHLKDSEWVLYHFVDQPFFSNDFYRKIISQISSECDWIQPVHNGKEGHPVMFNKKVIDLISKSSLDSHLRMIRDLPDVRKNYWNCGYREVLIDFDTPEDLKNFYEKN